MQNIIADAKSYIKIIFENDYSGHQIVFCTEKALKYLEYRCFEEVQE